jgi:hypothetical protein
VRVPAVNEMPVKSNKFPYSSEYEPDVISYHPDRRRP